MTAAEKMALEVECMTPFTSNDAILRDEAAALIRRLAAALVEAESAMPHNEFFFWRKRHADALRDVKEQA